MAASRSRDAEQLKAPDAEVGTPRIIAIDGPAGAGKSTTALRVARALGFAYVDSGAYYRTAALLALRLGLADDTKLDGPAVARALAAAEVEQRVEDDRVAVRLGEEEVTEALRSPEVTRLVSRVAAVPELRRVVTEKLRGLGGARGLVMDGRDIGTVVFPRASVKVFLDASLEARARRRSAAERRPVDPGSLAKRDELDRTRATAPLVPAPDATVLDTDDLTLDEQVARILELYRASAAPRP